ncbi:Uncharacterized protein GBIM_03390 [Gryllus bimaculatus]|nr:Uncharacterized protein GBIM_03390 [Gryllus bimaculatus]
MSEALAERLLDLHGRLLALYVLQDADCLHWEDVRPFFEGERGSFVVQMWWLYMQGTREHLWNTVPPQTAQRVLAGMLNESLAVLTSRLSQAAPSHARAPQLLTDAANVLLCCRHLLASVCSEGAELAGLPAAAAGGGAGGGSGGIGAGGGASGGGRVPRDVHAKCAELLAVLLARGSPLHSLYKVFRKGLGGVPVFSPRDHRLPAAWFVLTAPHLFGGDSASPGAAAPVGQLADGPAIALELTVLVAQPQASWPLLLRGIFHLKLNYSTFQEGVLEFAGSSDLESAEHEALSVANLGADGQGAGFL